jgi:hypothetical protein
VKKEAGEEWDRREEGIEKKKQMSRVSSERWGREGLTASTPVDSWYGEGGERCHAPETGMRSKVLRSVEIRASSGAETGGEVDTASAEALVGCSCDAGAAVVTCWR